MILALVGPSGVGKTSLSRFVTTLGYKEAVSTTTRHPRKGEIDGVDYHFVTKSRFGEMQRSGEFLESACYAGNYYGLTREALSDDNTVVVVEVQGLVFLKENYPKRLLSVLITVSSLNILEDRLRNMGRSDADIQQRLALVQTQINEAAPLVDKTLLNDDLTLSQHTLRQWLSQETS